MQHCQLNLFNMLQFQHLNCLNKKDTLMQGWLKSAILGGGSSYKDLGLSLGGGLAIRK